MNYIVTKIRSEPALLVGLVTAVLILLAEFGVELTQGQQAAIIGVIVAIGAIIVRSAVTPNIRVGALEDDHEQEGLMAGHASDIPDGDPVDVVHRDEMGAVEPATVATAAIVVLLVLFIVLLLL